MRNEANIRQAAMLRPDFMGFIFYPGSPRYVGPDFPPAVMKHLGDSKKVGVFVNQPASEVLKMVGKYALDYVQLHGEETIDQVREISKHVRVIKVISGNDLPGEHTLREFENYIDYWLIDTRTSEQHGGTGRRFDWNVIRELILEKGIILSGGIGVSEAAEARDLVAYGVTGIDVNSRAETEPGIKNIETLKLISNELHG